MRYVRCRVLTAGLAFAVAAAVSVELGSSPLQFTPTLEWRTLNDINALEATALQPYELNTSQSQIRLLGGFYGNYRQSWFPAIDMTRGLLYVPEVEERWPPILLGGKTVAVVDLKTLTVLRRLTIRGPEDEIVAPFDLAMDPIGNRLFVRASHPLGIHIADAETGIVQQAVQVPGSWLGFVTDSYSPILNRLFLAYYDGGFGGATFDLATLAVLPAAFPSPESYYVVNEASKLLYAASLGSQVVFAADVDPASPTFDQIVWTTTGRSTIPDGYLQPALDKVHQRLYVPDVEARVLKVFDARSGPGQHTELSPIPLDLGWSSEQREILESCYSPDRWESLTTRMVVPAVDPLTGLVYVVVSSRLETSRDDEGCFWGEGNVAAVRLDVIDPVLGLVGRAPLPRSMTPTNFVMVDPATRRIIVGTGEPGRSFAVLEDLRPSILSTPAGGTPVTVSAPEATVTFGAVQTGGTTTINPRSIADVNVDLPGQFAIEGGLLYDVSTTATTTGSISVCFLAAHIDDPLGFAALHVLHAEGGQWVDRTTTRDFAAHTICARTPSLSPFAVVRRTSPAYTARLLYRADRSFKAGSTAPIKVQVLDWAGTNVSSNSLPLRAVSLTQTSSATALAIEDAGFANPDAGFRYDPSLAGYIFNLSTRGLTSGTYTLSAEVGTSASRVQIAFSVR